MTPFEYVIVLISIVLGLGLTQLLTGVAELIHHWHRAKLYWPHSVWVVLAFFLHVQQWWELYDFRDVASWQLPVFFITILYPVILFILSRILFPSISNGSEPIDLKAFYFQHYRKFFVLIIVLAVVSAADDAVLRGFSFSDIVTELALVVIFSAMLTAQALNKLHEWLHYLVVSLLLAFVVIYMVVEWSTLTLN